MGKLNTTNYAILALLTMEPMSGYEIKKTIERTIGHFWQESFGHIYPTLKRLHAAKLVRRKKVRGQGKPDSIVYTLTARGRDELKEWLAIPVERVPVRNELLLKVAFGKHIAPEMLIGNLERYLAVQQRILQQYRMFVKLMGRENDRNPPEAERHYWGYTIRFGIHAVRGRIRWCKETLADLKARIER